MGRFGGLEGGQWAGGGRASQVAGKGAGGEPTCGMQELPPVSSPPVSRQFLMLKTNNQILGSTFPMLNTYSKVFGSTNISHCYLMPNYEIFYFDSSHVGLEKRRTGRMSFSIWVNLNFPKQFINCYVFENR